MSPKFRRRRTPETPATPIDSTQEPMMPEAPPEPYVPEALPPDLPAYVVHNFEYFLSRPDRAEARAEYIRRGITPTNNLRQYFVPGQPLELAPGIPNLLNHHNRPFGHILERLRQEQPELYAWATAACEARNKISREFVDLLKSGQREAADALLPQSSVLEWQDREVFSRVFDIIAPQMEAEGLDPLRACI